MTTPRDNSSLAEASAGRHVAQFHRDAEALSESAYLFLEGGLRRGTSVVIIATPANAERLLTHLSAGKFHPTALRDAGQLEVLDAATVLEQCMSGGGPEWGRFRATLGAVLDRARAAGHGTRIYADTTGMLWQDGNTDAAIRIEELWNALGQIFPFALYCGYMLDTQSEESYGGPLEEIGRTHTEIVGTIEDERFARTASVTFRAASGRCCGSSGTCRLRPPASPSARVTTTKTPARRIRPTSACTSARSRPRGASSAAPTHRSPCNPRSWAR
jgi:hypothetical protein